MKNKYYIINYDYSVKNNEKFFFIEELTPITDVTHFVRNVKEPEIEYLGGDSWDGIYIYYGAMLTYIKINRQQEKPIKDLNLIKGYYTDIKEAKKDLEKLIDFIKESEEKYIF